MYKILTSTGLLLLFMVGCGYSSSNSGGQYASPPSTGGSQYTSPPSSDEETLARFHKAFSEGATYENVGDRVGFSESQRAEYEAGRAQALRDIYGN